uniref:Uncharacterized protein n=1 Tax=Timema monikensis TaxID=170555 RepID=A0A7R9E4Z6_9NEOP|nr:unnamed protein product [Timema monikensis]
MKDREKERGDGTVVNEVTSPLRPGPVVWLMTGVTGRWGPKEVPVYNLTASAVKKMTWKEVLDIGRKIIYDYPFEMTVWYPDGNIRASKFMHNMCVIFLHFLPAYLIDFLMLIFFQKPFLYVVDKLWSIFFYGLLLWLVYSYSETARYVLDTITEYIRTVPVIRTLSKRSDF